MTDIKSNSYEAIYSIVQQIPKGKVTSYGIIAKLIGSGFSARVVGYAMNKVNNLENIPAHRVVNRNGLLTGRHHFSPPELMQQLLEEEGLTIKENKILNFQDFLWNPLEDATYL